ncbi:hypothetical protein FHR32_002203 [Streptosporangium album]|uniref:DUF2690 domain-containing protein n=1 Tax=Streptosporangium album TaxID=47479 RepID=A0A7W7RUQ5_9ACTN|nr:DUF2690 domain-containing protein [Streptosporangium album]MBB4937898.1 hypothetical protein [Streptosporangium album]
MKIRMVAAALLAASATLLATSPANALDYTGKDPYKSGCARSARVLKTADLITYADKKDVGDVKLMWSSTCKTSWGEVEVSPQADVSILVATDLKERGKTSYVKLKKGRGGRHWGPMLSVLRGRCTYAWAEARTGSYAKDVGLGDTDMVCRR